MGKWIYMYLLEFPTPSLKKKNEYKLFECITQTLAQSQSMLLI